ncbi:MAG: sps1F [Myxococcaceae bacterium]|nr:sps1F [Myxococcaceae bacterium]
MKPRKVGECRILGELGKGGMATVYRAVHEPLQREVAIKELPAEASKDKEALSRFRREALALGAFRHQNIVTLYDLIEKGDALYMVMELVDGPTLGDLLREGALPPEVAAVIAAQIAAALEHAHFARIIHRDLKPSNVMITKAGEVKLMDFGIAKDEGLDKLTRTGTAVGTPAYMSPEQCTGGEVDARSDLYSLGVLLYESLSGKRAFTGPTAGEVFAKIAQGKLEKLKKAAPNAPAELRAIVTRAMQLKPDKRYFDISEMRRALDSWVSKHLTMSEHSLLMAFLRHRGKITESEALGRLSQTEMTIMRVFENPPPPPRRWRWVMAALIGAGATAAATHAQWWPWVNATLKLKLP